MRQMWREGLLGLTDGGFDRSCFLYDPRTGGVPAPPPGCVSDRDGKQMQDKHRLMCRQVCGDAIVNWLWAYWQGRAEGVIGARPNGDEP